jgi:hypothetical protein
VLVVWLATVVRWVKQVPRSNRQEPCMRSHGSNEGSDRKNRPFLMLCGSGRHKFKTP